MGRRPARKSYLVLALLIAIAFGAGAFEFGANFKSNLRSIVAALNGGGGFQSSLEAAYQTYVHSAESGPTGLRSGYFEALGLELDKYSWVHSMTLSDIQHRLGEPDLQYDDATQLIRVYFYIEPKTYRKCAMNILFNLNSQLKDISWCYAGINDYRWMNKVKKK